LKDEAVAQGNPCKNSYPGYRFSKAGFSSLLRNQDRGFAQPALLSIRSNQCTADSKEQEIIDAWEQERFFAEDCFQFLDAFEMAVFVIIFSLCLASIIL